MLTRCPRCNTAFRVTSEQLKARQGRVRCGQCQAVFNALDALSDAPVAVAAPAPPSQPVPATAPVPPHEETARPAVVPLHAEPSHAETPRSGSAAAPVSDNEPLIETAQAATARAAETKPEDPVPAAASDEPPPHAPTTPSEGPALEPAQHPPEAGIPAAPSDASETREAPATSDADSAPETPKASLPDASDASDAPNTPDASGASDAPASSDEPAPEPPPPHEPLLHEAPPGRTWPWALGSVLALLVLFAQAVMHYRVELATLYPEAKPLLVAACAPLGCEVPLPRKPDLIGIEASNLSPENGSKLLLTATLRNRAPFAQQYPALEVTLTDTADQPLVRRVLAPAEYLPPQAPREGFPANAEMSLNLLVEAPGVPAAGYLLYVFYP